MFSFLVGFWCFWDFEMFFDWIFSGFQAMVLPQSCGNFYGKSRLSAEKRQLYFLWFSERSRHLVGTDVKEILEIPCQCWILQNSFSFLITRRSRGGLPSPQPNRKQSNGLLFSLSSGYESEETWKNPISLANVASRLTLSALH